MNDLSEEFQALCWLLKIEALFERHGKNAMGDRLARLQTAAEGVRQLWPDSKVAALFADESLEQDIKDGLAGKRKMDVANKMAAHVKLVFSADKPKADE